MEGTAERPEGAGLVAWVAHHQWWILGSLFVAETLTTAVRLTMPGSELESAMTWLTIAILVAYVVGEPMAWRHFSRLCAECVAAMPADGQQRAHRRQRLLYAFHMANAYRGRVAVALLAAILLPILLVYWGVWERGSFVAEVARVTAFLTYVGVSSALGMIHRPLVPWCPYCRWGRGGDGPREIVPDPVPPSRTPNRVT